MLPAKYMGVMMFGNGVSGVGTNLLKALLMVLLPGKENMFYVALIFFVLSALVLVACGLVYPTLNNSPFFQFYLK